MSIDIFGTAKERRILSRYISKAVEVFKRDKDCAMQAWSWSDGKLKFQTQFFDGETMLLVCTFKGTSFNKCRIEIIG